jgi:hypothetical protein
MLKLAQLLGQLATNDDSHPTRRFKDYMADQVLPMTLIVKNIVDEPRPNPSGIRCAAARALARMTARFACPCP